MDIILAAADEFVTEPRDLQRIVRRRHFGEKLTISFLRAGKQRKVTVVL
jgi:S1-C subfamily serine protease